MDLQLNGKRALVSGSTAGIGYAIAERLAQEGAHVIVNGRTQAAVDKAVAALQATTGGTVEGFAGDLSKAEAAEELVRLRAPIAPDRANHGVCRDAFARFRALRDQQRATWQLTAS